MLALGIFLMPAGLMAEPNTLTGKEKSAGFKLLFDGKKAIGAEVESQTRRRIEEGGPDPDGTPWEEWSDAYAGTRHAGHSLLVGEGDLLDSIQFITRGAEVEVGTNLIYGAIHQFGGDEVGMNIPARPYLGLSPDNEADLLGVVEDFIEEALRP